MIFSQIMLCLVVNGSFDLKQNFSRHITDRFPSVSTVLINYNSENTNVILGSRFETVSGSGTVTDTLCEKTL